MHGLVVRFAIYWRNRGRACDHFDMPSLRNILVATLCLLLIMARVMGMHAHQPGSGHSHDQVLLTDHHAMTVGSQWHEHGGSAEAAERLPKAANQFSGEHLSAHLASGEIDLDVPDKTSGKLPSLFFVALLLAFSTLAFGDSKSPATRLWRAPTTGRRRWTFFTPHSHAPPAAG